MCLQNIRSGYFDVAIVIIGTEGLVYKPRLKLHPVNQQLSQAL